jgi:AraC-like DNA-binding protein
MPKDVQTHLRLPIESCFGTLEVIPFHIWRNEKHTALVINPSDQAVASPDSSETLLFRCVVPCSTPRAASETLSHKALTSRDVFELHVHRSLLKTDKPPLPLSVQVIPIDIDDTVVGELAAAILTTLPIGSHNSYTVVCITKMLCARLSHIYKGDGHAGSGGFEDWQFSVLMEALDKSTDECASVAQIARVCRLSVCHFSRLFKAKFGMPLHRYRVNQRIREAKSRLVASSDPISQIALDCGFADQSSFTRRFTAVSGVSPGTWRRRGGQESAPCVVPEHLSRFANA